MNRLKHELVTVALSFLAMSSLIASDVTPEQEWEQELMQRRNTRSEAFTRLMDGVISVEVFTLDPSSYVESSSQEADLEPRLDGWRILQQIQISDPRETNLLVTGLKLSIETSGTAASCFEPRHALRFTKDGAEVLIIVCFQCGSMEVKGSRDFNGAAVSPAAEKDFYLVLRAHGLTKPNRLSGLSDQEITKQITGSWRKKSGHPTAHAVVIEYDEIENFDPDGTYRSMTQVSFIENRPNPKSPDMYSNEGKWHVLDGILILSGLPADGFTSSASIDRWVPIMEVSDTQFITATMAPDSDDEFVSEREP